MNRTIISTLVLVLVGCSGGIDEHPAPAGDDQGTVTTQETVVTSRRVCAEGVVEACWQYFHDSDGQLHCRISTRTCVADGYTWSDCGAPVPKD